MEGQLWMRYLLENLSDQLEGEDVWECKGRSKEKFLTDFGERWVVFVMKGGIFLGSEMSFQLLAIPTFLSSEKIFHAMQKIHKNSPTAEIHFTFGETPRISVLVS